MKSQLQEVKPSGPVLSIVVAIIEGGRHATESCLEVLSRDAEDFEIECIVPYDARLEDVNELAAKFPFVDFVDSRDHVDATEYGSNSREHHDILRAIGLRLATAPIVALIEDHAAPAAGWCNAVIVAHRDSKASAIGGAVENGVDRLLNWAVYYCDFGRYENPVPLDAVEFVSDSNVSYKRDALMAVREQWYSAFHETSVNWEIRRQGGELRLDPNMVVFQKRSNLRFVPALKERIVWGRSFAGTRASEISGLKRMVFICLTFALPFVLTSRIVFRGIQKNRHTKKIVFSLPLIFVLQIFWSIGEFVGYVTGRADTGRSRPRSLDVNSRVND